MSGKRKRELKNLFWKKKYRRVMVTLDNSKSDM